MSIDASYDPQTLTLTLTLIASPNHKQVVFFKLQEYIDHVRSSGLYRSSRTRTGRLEYTERERAGAFADGVEISVYAGPKGRA